VISFDVVLTVVLCLLVVAIVNLGRRLTFALHRLADKVSDADQTAGALAPVLARVADGLALEAAAIEQAVIQAVVLEPENAEGEEGC
jgi:hypothetical protein